LRLKVTGAGTPGSGFYDGWTLREEWDPTRHKRGAEPYGEYRILVERDVSSHDEVNDRLVEGVHLVEDMERVWSYATGMALRSRGFDIVLGEFKPPTGWSTNAREVDRVLQSQESDLIVGSLGITSTHWRTCEDFPLKPLVAALSAYRQADDLTRALVGFHFEGLMSRTDDGPEFLFAKGLEMVREMLPGADDVAKEAALHPDVRQSLTQSPHWLFGIANTRRNTRHPITKKPTTALHPAMTGQETLDYLRNADAVIRGVVCERLGLPFVAVRY
jgi:hypothetical protein